MEEGRLRCGWASGLYKLGNRLAYRLWMANQPFRYNDRSIVRIQANSQKAPATNIPCTAVAMYLLCIKSGNGRIN